MQRFLGEGIFLLAAVAKVQKNTQALNAACNLKWDSCCILNNSAPTGSVYFGPWWIYLQHINLEFNPAACLSIRRGELFYN